MGFYGILWDLPSSNIAMEHGPFLGDGNNPTTGKSSFDILSGGIKHG